MTVAILTHCPKSTAVNNYFPMPEGQRFCLDATIKCPIPIAPLDSFLGSKLGTGPVFPTVWGRRLFTYPMRIRSGDEQVLRNDLGFRRRGCKIPRDGLRGVLRYRVRISKRPIPPRRFPERAGVTRWFNLDSRTSPTFDLRKELFG